MNRDQKEATVAEITEELNGSDAVFIVNYRGISVPQAAELRTALAEADASFNIVKNRLAKIAVAATGDQDLDDHLVGPTALTYVKGDPVIAAKAISKFIANNGTISYKGGIMDGAALDGEGFQKISKLPSVEVLYGQLVGLAATPLTGVVRTLNQLIAGLATQLGQISEQGLVSGESPAAPSEGEASSGEASEGEASSTEEASADPGEPAPGDRGEPAIDVDPEKAGESDNPGGDDEILPDREGDDAGSDGDDGDDDASDDDAGDDAEETSDEGEDAPADGGDESDQSKGESTEDDADESADDADDDESKED